MGDIGRCGRELSLCGADEGSEVRCSSLVFRDACLREEGFSDQLLQDSSVCSEESTQHFGESVRISRHGLGIEVEADGFPDKLSQYFGEGLSH